MQAFDYAIKILLFLFFVDYLELLLHIKVCLFSILNTNIVCAIETLTNGSKCWISIKFNIILYTSHALLLLSRVHLPTLDSKIDFILCRSVRVYNEQQFNWFFLSIFYFICIVYSLLYYQRRTNFLQSQVVVNFVEKKGKYNVSIG